MKIIHFLSLGVLCLGSASTCLSAANTTASPSTDYQTIQEKIIFKVDYAPDAVSKTPPPPIALTMGHQNGSKMRDFHLSNDSSYGEMKSLTRQHITGDGRVGGYFVDEVISKDGQYVLILAGQVYETQQDGKKIYSKQGSWMDSLGRRGQWVDEVQEKHPDSALAACGGK